MDNRVRDALARAAEQIRTLRREKAELEKETERLRSQVEAKAAIEKAHAAQADELAGLRTEVASLKGTKRKRKTKKAVEKELDDELDRAFDDLENDDEPEPRVDEQRVDAGPKPAESEAERRVDEELDDALDDLESDEEGVVARVGERWVLKPARKARCDAEAMTQLARRLKTRSRTRLDREAALSHVRRALRDGAAVEALAAVSYGLTVHHAPCRVRKQSEFRAKVQAAAAHEKWTSQHVVLEIIAWVAANPDEASAAADLVVALASPARLGGDTICVAVCEIDRAAASWDAWVAGLRECRRVQVEAAVDFHKGLHENAKEAVAKLLSTLCERLGLCSPSRAEEPSLDWARRALEGDLGGLDVATMGDAAERLVRHDPLDDRAAKVRRHLTAPFRDEGGSEVASALLAALSGERDDASTALIDWARALTPSDRASLPINLLRKLAALCNAPVARHVSVDERHRACAARQAVEHGVTVERSLRVDDPPETIVATTWSAEACAVNSGFDTSTRGRRHRETDSLPALSLAERAYAAAHVAQWQLAKKDATPVVVLEDDATLADGFAQRVAEALRLVPRDFDVLLLGYFFPGGEHKNVDRLPTTIVRHFLKPAYFWGLHGYMLSPKGARRLLEHLPVDGPVDIFVAKLVHDATLTAYACHPKLIFKKTTPDVEEG